MSAAPLPDHDPGSDARDMLAQIRDLLSQDRPGDPPAQGEEDQADQIWAETAGQSASAPPDGADAGVDESEGASDPVDAAALPEPALADAPPAEMATPEPAQGLPGTDRPDAAQLPDPAPNRSDDLLLARLEALDAQLDGLMPAPRSPDRLRLDADMAAPAPAEDTAPDLAPDQEITPPIADPEPEPPALDLTDAAPEGGDPVEDVSALATPEEPAPSDGIEDLTEAPPPEQPDSMDCMTAPPLAPSAESAAPEDTETSPLDTEPAEETPAPASRPRHASGPLGALIRDILSDELRRAPLMDRAVLHQLVRGEVQAALREEISGEIRAALGDILPPAD